MKEEPDFGAILNLFFQNLFSIVIKTEQLLEATYIVSTLRFAVVQVLQKHLNLVKVNFLIISLYDDQ